MFTTDDLQELLEFHSPNVPVLSVYLNVDPTQHSTEEYRLILRGLLKEAGDNAAPEDIARVEKYFDFEYDWQGKGVVVFSCQAEGFWRTYSLAIPVPDQVYVGPRPYIRPLSEVLDDYSRYGVVLVDREGARLFLFEQGKLQETTGTLGELPKRHKKGGWAAQKYQRWADRHARRNLKEAAELTAKFFAGGRCNRLILGGTEDNVTQFQTMLPKALQDMVVGSFAIDMTASESEVLDHSLAVIRQVEREQEKQLVEQLIAAWKRGQAVVGLSDTLAAIQEQRVWILLTLSGYRESGYRCESCHYLALQERAACPLCGGEMKRMDDIVDHAVRRAMEQGIEVETVRDNQELEKVGQIGAILRY
ncbi:MAG: Vms1/Ankzf1 family peptidyl-tRNA hydrolase [Anaerolineae bacterium]|jgi:peptide subunit release factor 1 (eRF1)|nr:Vms1/Ankzf1 family peptidyl-tRNA hydrolase [Anaerolineae bacterium]MDH7475210.1 Vms1/Ankzf1 family peptidyl-tRNA hydrolase [Anaerolineae bacterium]